MKPLWVAALLMSSTVLAAAPPQVVALPSKSPLVTFRFVFLTGAAADPAGKPGVAALTAAMLAEGGTRTMTYKQIVDALFPMAASVSEQVDQEMITFSGTTHVDNLEAYYSLLRTMLLEPGWRQEDFVRLRDDAVNFLRVSLRGNNDEELGKEVLYNQIYAGHPYGHHDLGAVSALERMTVADLQQFYREHFTQSSLVIGLAGGYPEGFLQRVEADFRRLPVGTGREGGVLPAPRAIQGLRMLMVEKNTRSVAYSIGFPIDVRRGDPDYAALLLAQTYFGQHRLSGGRLYERMREVRGLNYGDYAYIEYFPRGMFQFEPDPNLARRQQIFQIWIRPVGPPTAHFALRLAMYELDKLIREGISEENFERTRMFLTKYVNLLMKTKRAELGYAIDSRFYGIPDYSTYLRSALAKLTVADVNQAIRKHLRATDLLIVVVARNCEELKKQFLAGAPSPMTYNSPKPQQILDEDRIVERWKLDLKPENITIVPVDSVFE
ncbi:MAG: pitrilysin family protein [Bryobacteraceae bacterium]|jgi:zinc protease